MAKKKEEKKDKERSIPKKMSDKAMQKITGGMMKQGYGTPQSYDSGTKADTGDAD